VFIALLDTNVLWPSLQRDFLLSLHIQGVYRALWSEAILEELQYSEVLKLQRRGVTSREAALRARSLLAQLREHFADSIVHGWEQLEGTFGLPDPDDEHVVAAAVVGGAEMIVTENLRDFPAHCLPTELEAVAPAEFARRAVDRNPRDAVAAVDEIVARSGRFGPPLTRELLFGVLETRYRMGEAVGLMREEVEG